MAVEEVVEALRAAGHRVGSARLRMLEVLEGAGEMLSADAIAAQVPGLSVSTVYRTLATLEGLGLVTHTHLDQRVAVYGLADGETAEPVLICQSCGQRTAVSARIFARAGAELRRDHKFIPDFSHFAIAGLCAECHGRNPTNRFHAHF